MDKQITHLPSSVISQLRSSTILSNVAQIAEELVCNSLDAEATQIEVSVDGEACHMKVDDDGRGISRDDLTLVGERHATSKLHRLEELEGGVATLGFRGEALSSLSDVALVEITSRCRGTPNTYRKILRGCATVSIGLCSEQRTYGTSVVVRDIFYNKPVRRRLLNSSYRKILQSVKECVTRFVLIHPHVSFMVRDLSRNTIVLHTKSAGNLRGTLCDMFGENMFSRLQEVDHAEGHLRLTGFISKAYHSHPSKALQYFYINRRFVLKTAIHKLFNSWVGPNNHCNTGKCKDVGKTYFKEEMGRKEEPPTGKYLSPSFVLNMTCPLSDYDITFEPSKTLVEFKDWIPVMSFVKGILQMMWGNQSGCKKQGCFHPPESPEIPLTKASSNGNVCGQTGVELRARRNEDIPPMALRRALVQSKSHHLSNSIDIVNLREKEAVVSGDRQDHPRTASRCPSPPADLPGQRPIAKTLCFEMNSRAKQMASPTNICQTNCDSDGDGRPLARRTWLVTPCRKQRTFDQPEISARVPKEELFPTMAGSDWLLQGMDYISPELEQQNLLVTGKAFKRLRSNQGMSAFMSENKQYLSSSVCEDRRLLSSSASQVKAHERDWLIEQSKSPGLDRSSFSDDNELGWFSPGKEMDDDSVQRWWEHGDFKFKTSLWSGSDDSIDIPRVRDTSDLMPEVSSCSQSVASRTYGENEFESDGDRSESEKNWTSRTQTRCKRQKFVNGSDHGRLHDFLPTKSTVVQPELDHYLENEQIRDPNCDKWKINRVDASEGNQNGLRGYRESLSLETDGGICSVTSIEKHHGYNVVGKYLNTRSKRRLDLMFEDKSDDPNYGADHGEGQKWGNQDDVQHASMGRPGRGFSGPPFCRPPHRYGLHVNPPQSLSTVRREGHQTEGTVVTKPKTDPRVGTVPQAPHDRKVRRKAPSDLSIDPIDVKSSRDQPRSSMDCLEIIPIQTAKPCADPLPIQGKSCLDWGPLIKHRQTKGESTGTKQAEFRLNTEKSMQPVQEITPHQQYKYRSTDVNSNGIGESEFPSGTVKAMFKEWSNPCMKKEGDILDLLSGTLTSNHGSLLPSSISKDVLKGAHVLQQVDTKFIASVSCGILLLIDQHAADERVRLEELREEVLDGKSMKQVSLLSCTQELTVAFIEHQMLQTYRRQIEEWGWRYKVSIAKKSPTCVRPAFSTGGLSKVLLSAVPCILGVCLTAEDLTEYLRQLIDTEGSSVPPPAVIRVLNNKACRGAIMFGDALLPAECSQLIERLKKTLLCFQCAHGRPTMVPLVDLRALHKRFDLSGSSKIRANIGLTVPRATSGAKWHGLQQGIRPTIERAQARLGLAHDLSS